MAGICFGIILGWVIGTQQARRPGPGRRPLPPPASGRRSAHRRLGSTKVGPGAQHDPQERPQEPTRRFSSATLYFDAERWDDAIKWYQTALEARPENVTPAPIWA